MMVGNFDMFLIFFIYIYFFSCIGILFLIFVKSQLCLYIFDISRVFFSRTLLNGPEFSTTLVKFQERIADAIVLSKRNLRWCPAPDCKLAVEVPHSKFGTVTCTCGAQFCFQCGQENHTPLLYVKGIRFGTRVFCAIRQNDIFNPFQMWLLLQLMISYFTNANEYLHLF